MSTSDLGRPKPEPVRCAVLTISDTRTHATDASGQAIADMLGAAGHQIVERRLLPDEPALVRHALLEWIARADVQVVVTTGGTGIARRDSTYEAVYGLLDKHMPGFGELFRMLSFRDVGPAAMLSRATAGTVERTALFVLPGSEPAVRLAMSELIVPELEHVARELVK
jgi:molybdopterin adenylyltransferase